MFEALTFKRDKLVSCATYRKEFCGLTWSRPVPKTPPRFWGQKKKKKQLVRISFASNFGHLSPLGINDYFFNSCLSALKVFGGTAPELAHRANLKTHLSPFSISGEIWGSKTIHLWLAPIVPGGSNGFRYIQLIWWPLKCNLPW